MDLGDPRQVQGRLIKKAKEDLIQEVNNLLSLEGDALPPLVKHSNSI